jgi:hypothetical protein
LKKYRLLFLLELANDRLKDGGTAFRIMASILVLGAAIRFAWLIHSGLLPNHLSEAFYEEAAFAERGELADAFGPGTGLTTHLSPGMPLLVGTIYRWLGTGARSAEFALACLSIACIYVSFLALSAAFRNLGVAPIARMAALGALALVPLNLFYEMNAFRQWEGGFAAAGVAVCLARATKLDGAGGQPGWLDFAALAAGGALMSLFSPPAALACYGMLGWLALRKRGWAGFASATAASIALFLVFSYPWALRNEAVFGEKVWTRTSLGMNLALVYNDKNVSPADEGQTFWDRLPEVDPFLSSPTLAKMKAAGGEVEYNKLMTAQTEEWMRQHPGAALRIAARHIFGFYFPPRCAFYLSVQKYSNDTRLVGLRQALT